MLLAKHPSIPSPVFCVALLSEAQSGLDVESPCVLAVTRAAAKQLGGKMNVDLDGWCAWWERMCGRQEGEGGMPLSLGCCHCVVVG